MATSLAVSLALAATVPSLLAKAAAPVGAVASPAASTVPALAPFQALSGPILIAIQAGHDRVAELPGMGGRLSMEGEQGEQ